MTLAWLHEYAPAADVDHAKMKNRLAIRTIYERLTKTKRLNRLSQISTKMANLVFFYG